MTQPLVRRGRRERKGKLRLKAKEIFDHGIPRTKDAEDITRKTTEERRLKIWK